MFLNTLFSGLHHFHLVPDVSRKERVALTMDKIPPDQLLGLSLACLHEEI